MAVYRLIVERNDSIMEFGRTDESTLPFERGMYRLRPGDSLTIELRDYTPPDECEEDLATDVDGARYYTDDVCTIGVAP